MARGTTNLIIYGVVGYALWKSGILNQVLAKLPSGVSGVGAAPLLPGGSNSGGTSSTLQSILAINPNFWAQMQEWQAARARNGEDPQDWQALRTHLRGIGAPDPGTTPPAEFSGARG